eukprot:SAG22_NODE_10141_length_550_cov_2.055432_2_plen_55_part_01
MAAGEQPLRDDQPRGRATQVAGEGATDGRRGVGESPTVRTTGRGRRLRGAPAPLG